MQMIQFLGADTSPNGVRAVAPIVHQSVLVAAVGSGAALQDVLPEIAADECAAHAGQVINTGCYDVKLTVSYLTGGDCDTCTVDVLTVEDLEITVPKNSAFPLPVGLVKQIQAQTLDSAGEPVANSTEQTVKYYGHYVPGCTGCTLVP